MCSGIYVILSVSGGDSDYLAQLEMLLECELELD